MTRRFLWKVRSCSASALAVSAYVFEVIWSDIDLYHAYRDFTTDPVRYPARDMRGFISELASVPASGDLGLIDMSSISGRKRTTLCTYRGCGDPRVNQQNRQRRWMRHVWGVVLTPKAAVPTI
jgi:hypothetical protein